MFDNIEHSFFKDLECNVIDILLPKYPNFY